ncbi:MAG: hypothetical protein ACRDT4_04480 [Micromonosporaceae bacterium]
MVGFDLVGVGRVGFDVGLELGEDAGDDVGSDGDVGDDPGGLGIPGRVPDGVTDRDGVGSAALLVGDTLALVAAPSCPVA